MYKYMQYQMGIADLQIRYGIYAPKIVICTASEYAKHTISWQMCKNIVFILYLIFNKGKYLSKIYIGLWKTLAQ